MDHTCGGVLGKRKKRREEEKREGKGRRGGRKKKEGSTTTEFTLIYNSHLFFALPLGAGE